MSPRGSSDPFRRAVIGAAIVFAAMFVLAGLKPLWRRLIEPPEPQPAAAPKRALPHFDADADKYAPGSAMPDVKFLSGDKPRKR